jgi:hypothetical protein
MTKEEALRLALEALELVSIEFVCNNAHHTKKDRHEWLDPCPVVDRYKKAITAIKEALETKNEPFEYWNAVEGWVKLDEVREHFESASCGTIYKNGGEGRVPLYTTPQRTWVGLTQEEFEKLINDAGFTRSDLLMIGACIEQIVDLVEAKLKEKNT